MAVPKKKVSPGKRGSRRAHDALKPANIVFDKNTGEPKLSHHISMVDGMYNERKVFTPKMRNKLPDTEGQLEEEKA